MELTFTPRSEEIQSINDYKSDKEIQIVELNLSHQQNH